MIISSAALGDVPQIQLLLYVVTSFVFIHVYCGCWRVARRNALVSINASSLRNRPTNAIVNGGGGGRYYLNWGHV